MTFRGSERKVGLGLVWDRQPNKQSTLVFSIDIRYLRRGGPARPVGPIIRPCEMIGLLKDVLTRSFTNCRTFQVQSYDNYRNSCWESVKSLNESWLGPYDMIAVMLMLLETGVPVRKVKIDFTLD